VLDYTNDEAILETGDVNICWECHGLSLMTVDNAGAVSLALPSQAELAQISTSPQARQILGAMTECYTPMEVAGLLGNVDWLVAHD
jgi:hypothetical protein